VPNRDSDGLQSLSYVVAKLVRRSHERAAVRVAVHGDLVAGHGDLSREFRLLLDHSAEQEKCGSTVDDRERVKNAWSGLPVRSVVK
jgi:hypothetical protein